MAPRAPATRPAIAPVRFRFVGAPLRKAQINRINGTVAKSGIHRFSLKAARCRRHRLAARSRQAAVNAEGSS